jgi:hypothetical protein
MFGAAQSVTGDGSQKTPEKPLLPGAEVDADEGLTILLVARNGIFSIPRSPPSRRCMKKPGKIGVSSRAPPEKRSKIRKPYVLAGLIRTSDPDGDATCVFPGLFHLPG